MSKMPKIAIDLQTALAADAHLAEGQWLQEQVILVLYRKMNTDCWTEGWHLVPL